MEFDIMTAISTIGFPIAVAAFCLVKLETTMKANTDATKDNSSLTRELIAELRSKR